MPVEPKKYALSDLPKMTALQAKMTNTLVACMAPSITPSQLHVALNSEISEILRVESSLALDDMQIISHDVMSHTFAAPDCFIAVAAPPKAGFCFVSIQTSLAKEMIYRALGSDQAPGASQDAISDVEKGILTFVVLKALRTIQEKMGDMAPGQLQVVAVRDSFDGVQSYVQPLPYALLGIQVAYGSTRSYLRLLLPQGFFWGDKRVLQKNEDTQRKNAIARVASVEVPILVQLGRVMLAPDDLKALEKDDIIVLEKGDIQLKEQGIVGKVKCQVGIQEYGSFTGRLLLAKSGHYAVQVGDVSTAAAPEQNSLLQ